MVLASALLAAERARVAKGHAPVLRVGFPKPLDVVRGMWFTLMTGENLLSEALTNRMVKRAYTVMRTFCLTPARRSRSCPRAVRQPVTRWPRLLKNESIEGPAHFELR